MYVPPYRGGWQPSIGSKLLLIDILDNLDYYLQKVSFCLACGDRPQVYLGRHEPK